MKLGDVKDGMRVRITAGPPGHPLHGATGHVFLVTAPIPDDPPVSLRDPAMKSVAHLINSNRDEEPHRVARAYRKETLEQPFAFPHGRVEVALTRREPASARTWMFPYITVGPDDIEPA